MDAPTNPTLFERVFPGFGLCRLSEETPSVYRIDGIRASTLRVRVRQEAPRRPGTYGMLDEHGDLVYVGKAKCLRSRLLSYFQRGREPKAAGIIRETRSIVWELVPDEFGALLRELELIRRWRPKFNVVGIPRRQRRTYICLGRGPAPYIFLSARPAGKLSACWGPVSQTTAAREAVRSINDYYQLRDCPQQQKMIFADQEELFPVVYVPGCIRHEIGTCTAPCAAKCSSKDYQKQVESAKAFLFGEDPGLIHTLYQQMTEAGEAMQFEKAASLRDRVDSLNWLWSRLENLRQASTNYNFIYPVRGHNHADRWYFIRGGRVIRIVPWPREESDLDNLKAAIHDLYRVKCSIDTLPKIEELDGIHLVASWFRRQPEELKKTLTPGEVVSGAKNN